MAEFERTSDGRVVEVRRSSSAAGWLIALVIIVALVVAAFALGFIKIGQTQDGRLPDVKVETSGGQAPKFDVSTAKVDVGTREETVKVPTVSVKKADEPTDSK